MGFFDALFSSKKVETVPTFEVKPAGLVKDANGWYYKESQEYSKNQNSIRIDQNRPGEWRVIEGFCEVDGLNSPERADEVQRFFTGSYRWIRFEREPVSPKTINKVKVIGLYKDKKNKKQESMLGHLTMNAAEEIERQDVKPMWGRIRFLRFPKPGRAPRYFIRFDLMGPAEQKHAKSA
jgi:hypothetical protein